MIYWLIFFGILFANIRFKKNSSVYLRAGFYLFIAGSAVSILGVFNISEFIFRICFIFLLIGFAFSAKDYLKD